jgi:transposase-like protein
MKAQVKHRTHPKIYTREEKQRYCLEWKKSGKSKTEFCELVGLPKSTFYSWCYRFKQKIPSDTLFSPVALKTSPNLESEKLMQLEICLPNQTKLSISIQKNSLISFIQELSNATTIVR